MKQGSIFTCINSRCTNPRVRKRFRTTRLYRSTRILVALIKSWLRNILLTNWWIDSSSLDSFLSLPHIKPQTQDFAAAFWSTESGSPEIIIVSGEIGLKLTLATGNQICGFQKLISKEIQFHKLWRSLKIKIIYETISNRH